MIIVHFQPQHSLRQKNNLYLHVVYIYIHPNKVSTKIVDIANYIRQKVENGSTNQRLPMEIIERLKQLIPIMLDACS
jgi:hypothetical protein